MSDPIRTTCPGCDSTIRASSQHQGKTVRCPKCNGPVSLPVQKTATAKATDKQPNGSPDRPRSPIADRPAPTRRKSASAGSQSGSKQRSGSRRGTAKARQPRAESDGELDFSEALADIDDYEDLEGGEFEDYNDFDATPVRRNRKSAKRNKVDTSVSGVWRDGKILVIAHGARLPKRCIKTNQRGTKKKTVELAYTHPLVYILQLPLIIVTAAFGGFFLFRRYRKAEVDLWYSKNWLRTQRLAWFVGVLTLIAGMGMIAWGILGMKLILVPIGFFCMFAGLIGPGWRESISVKKIDDDYVRLRGAGRAFLDSLPEWRKSRSR